MLDAIHQTVQHSGRLTLLPLLLLQSGAGKCCVTLQQLAAPTKTTQLAVTCKLNIKLGVESSTLSLEAQADNCITAPAVTSRVLLTQYVTQSPWKQYAGRFGLLSTIHR